MNTRDAGIGLGGSLSAPMPDVQGSADDRCEPIQRVGVRGLRYPLRWREREAELPTVAVWSLAVALPAEQKGTHMSRFVALLEEDAERMSIEELPRLHARMLQRLEATSGRIELSFPLFLRKTAPVSGVQSTLDYQLSLSVDGGADCPAVTVAVVVPVTSLCPCSKGVSDYGAHNQRSHVTVTLRLAEPASLDVRGLIERIERQASSELYGLLKRVDEKFVTERAYDNPKFVEDLVRDVAGAVRATPGVAGFVVEAENFESIHNHSAWARIES
jgi:GTP cyclohydrolase IB